MKNFWIPVCLLIYVCFSGGIQPVSAQQNQSVDQSSQAPVVQNLPQGVTPVQPAQGAAAPAGQQQFEPKPMEDDEAGGEEQTSIKDQLDRKDALLRVYTSVDQTKITIGQTIKYRIEMVADKNISVEFPQFGEMLGSFAIIDFSQDDPQRKGDTVHYQREYVLDMYLTGKYVIPPARITYTLGDSQESKTLFTAPIFVTVDSMLTDEDTQLRGLKPVVTPEIKVNKLQVTLAVAGVLVLIGLAVAGFIFWRRKQNYIPPGLPPHLIALNALEQIRQQQLVEQGQVKEYYYLVSNVLRHYIEGRFGLMAPERTTEEFLFELQKTPALSADNKSVLKTFLTHCDMVKFAKFSPTQEQIEDVYATAVQFIDQTKPAEQLPPEDDDEYDEYEEEE